MVQPGESLGVQWSPPLLPAFGKDVEPNDCPHDPHGVTRKDSGKPAQVPLGAVGRNKPGEWSDAEPKER